MGKKRIVIVLTNTVMKNMRRKVVPFLLLFEVLALNDFSATGIRCIGQ
jgi:hypothetical protein